MKVQDSGGVEGFGGLDFDEKTTGFPLESISLPPLQPRLPLHCGKGSSETPGVRSERRGRVESPPLTFDPKLSSVRDELTVHRPHFISSFSCFNLILYPTEF